jgi:creatine kinase
MAESPSKKQKVEGAKKAYPPDALSETLAECPDWIKAGCGNDEYNCPEKGATFPGLECPEKLPDLSKHGNLCAVALRDHPDLYEKYKNVKTSMGVTLAKCIKTGIDNPGHPHILTCGLVAGDEESYTAFKEVFDIVIDKRHGGYAPDAKHPSSMDVSKLSQTKIDPSGKYVLTTRCRTGRSVRGLPLPPSCSFEQRRELERVIVSGLKKMDGELEGEYFGLFGSESMPGAAMTKEKGEYLRNKGNLFQEPDSTLLLSSGCGRHWPDARGIFHNKAENFFVWVNEEDHMRIISMEKGDNIRAIFTRFANATEAVQKSLKGDGYDFMHNDHLGFILTCPSNLGTGLRAGAMVKIPLFSARKDFKTILNKMKLQARGTAGVDSASTGGTWDISNADRLGTSEVDLCNIFIEGLAQIIKWEQALEAGKDIEEEVAKAGPPPKA